MHPWTQGFVMCTFYILNICFNQPIGLNTCWPLWWYSNENFVRNFLQNFPQRSNHPWSIFFITSLISSLNIWLCFSFYLISPGEGLIYCCRLKRKVWWGRLLQAFLALNLPFHIRNICALLAAQDHTHLLRLWEICREAGCFLALGFKCHKLIGVYEQAAGPLTIPPSSGPKRRPSSSLLTDPWHLPKCISK